MLTTGATKQVQYMFKMRAPPHQLKTLLHKYSLKSLLIRFWQQNFQKQMSQWPTLSISVHSTAFQIQKLSVLVLKHG